jgi:galactonate dehydratase
MIDRRSWLRGLASVGGLAGLDAVFTAERTDAAQIGPKDTIKVTKIETFVLKNTWVFVKVSTDAGIVGWGEMLKNDARACAVGALEAGDYLIGQDPCRIAYHWQAIHRGSFYRGGPIKTAILSGLDMALWDIKGKVYGVPVYKLLGGPTRDRIRVYGRVSKKTGVNATKAIPRGLTRRPHRHNEGQKLVDEIVDWFKALRQKLEADYGSSDVDIGVEFHGAVQPTTALRIVKALEPYNPWFYEEVVQALNVDVMAEIARQTHIPLATGERIFTKWGFRELLEKRAATILQPDVCYAGGITELRIIAGMAEAYYTPIAPHNPNGPCSLAASMQIAASIPNFLIQEAGDRNHYGKEVQYPELDLLAKPMPPVVNGYRPLLTDPGLGITIDEDKLMAHLADPHTPRPRRPPLDPDDGSVHDR